MDKNRIFPAPTPKYLKSGDNHAIGFGAVRSGHLFYFVMGGE